jgi:diamine N-acetyltransferase
MVQTGYSLPMSDREQEPGLGPDATVTLREVTDKTLRSVLKLAVRPDQEQFVAPNAVSIAEAYFEPKAWFRAIYADETPVGFVMLFDDAEAPEYFLWRFMIDARYQRHGYGRRAIELLIDYVRTRPNARELLLSYVPAEGSPEPFYVGIGFVNTGRLLDGEMVMALAL